MEGQNSEIIELKEIIVQYKEIIQKLKNEVETSVKRIQKYEYDIKKFQKELRTITRNGYLDYSTYLNCFNDYKQYFDPDFVKKLQESKYSFEFTLIPYIKDNTYNDIFYGTIPENWIIPEPQTVLRSGLLKEYLKDGKLLTRIYVDNNLEIRNGIKSYLQTLVPYGTHRLFIEKIKDLSKKFRYIFKTDLISAYYNIKFIDILETLKYFQTPEPIYNYIAKYFEHIKTKNELKDFLYVTNYSHYLMGAHLQKILFNVNFISRFDDIIIYGNTKEEIKYEFDKMVSSLEKHKLYLNKKKSALYDMYFNSIFILRSIINIPKSGIIDDVTINILKQAKKKREYIQIMCDDKDDCIKSILKS